MQTLDAHEATYPTCLPDEAMLGLVLHLPRRRRASHKLLMLRAYLDDSGNDGRSPVSLVCGYIASFEAWERHSEDWHCMLAAAPTIDYVHMTEADGLRDEFHGFEESEKDGRLADCCQIINKHVAAGVAFAIPYEQHLRYFTPDKKNKHRKMALHAAAQAAYGIGRYVSKEFPGETVEIVFDNGSSSREDSFKKNLVDYMSRIFRDHPLYAPLKSVKLPIQFGDDKVLPGLQSADVLAWHLNAMLCGRLGRNNLTRMRILAKKMAGGTIMTEEIMQAAQRDENVRNMLASIGMGPIGYRAQGAWPGYDFRTGEHRDPEAFD